MSAININNLAETEATMMMGGHCSVAVKIACLCGDDWQAARRGGESKEARGPGGQSHLSHSS